MRRNALDTVLTQLRPAAEKPFVKRFLSAIIRDWLCSSAIVVRAN